MTVDWTKPIQLATGAPARLVFTDEKSSTLTRLVVIDEDEKWASDWFHEDGSSAYGPPIINVPERVTRYGAIFGDGSVSPELFKGPAHHGLPVKQFAIHIEGGKISAEWVE